MTYLQALDSSMRFIRIHVPHASCLLAACMIDICVRGERHRHTVLRLFRRLDVAVHNDRPKWRLDSASFGSRPFSWLMESKVALAVLSLSVCRIMSDSEGLLSLPRLCYQAKSSKGLAFPLYGPNDQASRRCGVPCTSSTWQYGSTTGSLLDN